MSSPLARLFDGVEPTLAIAHRGGAALAPENTLPAFDAAVRAWGCQMLELDVQATADGALVVWHDATVDRMTEHSGAISSLSLDTLRRLDAGHRFSPDGQTHPFRGRGVRVVTLAELLERYPDTRLNIELKPEAAAHAETFAREVTPHLDRVCVGSESDALGARLHALLPDACHFYPREALSALVLALKLGATPPEEPRYQVLDMPLFHEGMRLIDPDFLRAAERLGKWVNVWTVDDPQEMRALIAEGVGGIMTDRPDLLRAALDERR